MIEEQITETLQDFESVCECEHFLYFVHLKVVKTEHVETESFNSLGSLTVTLSIRNTQKITNENVYY